MNYALINNGVVENVIVADATFIANLSGYEHKVNVNTPEGQFVDIGCLYDAGTGEFTSPALETEVIPDTWKITKLAFKNRFPRPKWIAAKAAATVDPILADFFETFELSTFVDLQRADTIDYVNALANEAIPESFRLTEAEVSAVVNTPATPEETPVFI